VGIAIKKKKKKKKDKRELALPCALAYLHCEGMAVSCWWQRKACAWVKRVWNCSITMGPLLTLRGGGKAKAVLQ